LKQIRLETFSFVAAALACCACGAMHPKTAPKADAPAAAAAAAPAAAPAAPAPAPAEVAMPTGKTHKIWGVVSSVDASAGTVTITAHGRTRTLKIASGAKLTRGGEMTAIALSDVAAGDHVDLHVAGDVAASVHVKVIAAK
jgi:hypothetical protein